MSILWSHITENTSYADIHGALVGIYALAPGKVVLLDSGGRPCPEFLEELDHRGLRVRAIICTHLHVDHVANNIALAQAHGAEIFATAENIAFSDFNPPRSMGMPGKGPVQAIPPGDFFEIDGAPFGILPTPGHVPGHAAVITPDGVCHLGDSVMSGEILARAKMPYMVDVDEAVASMESIRQTAYPYYIVSHNGVYPQAEMPALMDENIQKELDIYDLLRTIAVEPMEMEELVRRFIAAARIRPNIPPIEEGTRRTSRARVFGLIHAGELALDGSIVFPLKR